MQIVVCCHIAVSGKSTGRRLKKTLLKLAVKTAIAWRQNKINKEVRYLGSG